MAKQNKFHKTEELKHLAFALPVNARGRFFEGTVTKKFPTRVAIEFERMVKVPKYERFYKKSTRIHARLPTGMNVQLGDYIQVQECRPLSKIIHHVVIKVIRSADSAEVKK